MEIRPLLFLARLILTGHLNVRDGSERADKYVSDPGKRHAFSNIRLACDQPAHRGTADTQDFILALSGDLGFLPVLLFLFLCS
jgi:hypothetical protein